MADIQLHHFRHRGNRLHRVEGKPVTGMAFESQLYRICGGVFNMLKLLACTLPGFFAVTPGMQLHHLRARFCRRFHVRHRGI